MITGAPRIGYAAIPAKQLIGGEVVEGWLDFKDESGEIVGMRGKKVNDLLCRSRTSSPAVLTVVNDNLLS